MANPMANMNGYLPGEMEDIQQIQRAQRYADLLRQQSMEPDQGQMVSGRFVAPSWTQHLAKLGQALIGSRAQDIASEKAKNLENMRTQRREEWLGQMPVGVPEQKVPQFDASQPYDQTPTIQTIPAKNPSSQDYLTWGMKGMQVDPMMAQVGMKYADIIEGREAHKQEREMQLAALQEAKRQADQARMDQLRLQYQLQGANQQALAAINAANRPPVAPTVTTIQDPNNPDNMLTVDARTYRGGSVNSPGVIGVSGKSAAAQQKALTVDAGRKNVSDMVANLYDKYTQLEKSGGIVNPQASALENIGAAASSSGAGQMVGKIIGTKNQSLRNDIEQTRPLLLSAIKNATGMSAQQMNSNAELKFYLNAATDPKLDVKANKAALERLDRMYGLSGQQSNANQLGQSGSTGLPSVDAIEAELARRRGK